MSTNVTPDEHIALLVSCIKTLTGKIDFAVVARDCNIVTATAAQKRYSRLLKANETAMQNANANGEAAASNTADQDQAPTNGSPAKAGRKRPAANKGKGKAKTTSTDSGPPRKKAREQKKKAIQQEETEEEQVDNDVYEDAETGEEDGC
ncbi:hypothetical protein BJX65DRAFT_301320 [Aspergillus insuetus]